MNCAHRLCKNQAAGTHCRRCKTPVCSAHQSPDGWRGGHRGLTHDVLIQPNLSWRRIQPEHKETIMPTKKTEKKTTAAKAPSKRAARVAQATKGSGKVPEQLSFDDPQWKELMKTELGRALTDYAAKRKEIEKAESDVAVIGDRVLIEMKKQGKTYIRPQIDGVFYDFEIKRVEKEKLFFKRANP